MIAEALDCLVFQLANGESVPCSAATLSVELLGEAEDLFDRELVSNAAAAVFYYFKHELGRQIVTAAEFAVALERALGGFAAGAKVSGIRQFNRRVLQSDLGQLATESNSAGELFFFPRLRQELRSQLQHEPHELHFRGLRGCVKQLAGARRWSGRCGILQEQIVEFLRNCLSVEEHRESCALLVR